MKTPMQEVYENFNLMSDADFKAWMLNTDLLEKEKEVMCEFAKLYDDDLSNGIIRTREDLFNETFNTKER
jgi:hypothetical protein